MADRKTAEERIQALEKKLEQLQNQKKMLVKKQHEAERKARTKRLIEIGAEVESALGYPLDSQEMRKALGDWIRKQEASGRWVSKGIKYTKPE